jgi:hypothetical protein
MSSAMPVSRKTGRWAANAARRANSSMFRGNIADDCRWREALGAKIA